MFVVAGSCCQIASVAAKTRAAEAGVYAPLSLSNSRRVNVDPKYTFQDTRHNPLDAPGVLESLKGAIESALDIFGEDDSDSSMDSD